MPWEEWQKILALCYSQITLVDAAGGLILDTLEELGLADNTIVIWTTDQGDGIACHGGHFDKQSYMPEEMLRIPMTVRWPDKIKPGQVSTELTADINSQMPSEPAWAQLYVGYDNGNGGIELLPGGDRNGFSIIDYEEFYDFMPSVGNPDYVYELYFYGWNLNGPYTVDIEGEDGFFESFEASASSSRKVILPVEFENKLEGMYRVTVNSDTGSDIRSLIFSGRFVTPHFYGIYSGITNLLP